MKDNLKKTKQIAVFVGLVENDGKVLMGLRNEPECPNAHLKWEFPGGKCDFGETPEEAVVREIREETGVEVRVERLLPTVLTHYWEYDWGTQQTLVFCFKCTFIKQHEIAKDHHVKEAKWIEIGKLKEYDLLDKNDIYKFLK